MCNSVLSGVLPALLHLCGAHSHFRACSLYIDVAGAGLSARGVEVNSAGRAFDSVLRGCALRTACALTSEVNGSGSGSRSRKSDLSCETERSAEAFSA